LSALQPFPSRIAGGEQSGGSGASDDPQEIAPVDHPVVNYRAIFVSTPMRPQVAIVPQGWLIDPNS
jgi:hypothetical protein